MSMIQCHYEINVSKKGRHFFATASRSCVTMGEMQEVYWELVKAFPASKGYEVTVTQIDCSGRTITPGEGGKP